MERKQRKWEISIKMLGALLAAMFMMLLNPVVVAEAAPNADGSVEINETNFPDANFRAYVETLSGASDGLLTETELQGVNTISVSSKNITSLEGIQYFVNLKILNCSKNQLAALDVSNNVVLNTLKCSNNQLTSLDVSKNVVLGQLECQNNKLTALDLSANAELWYLDMEQNELTALDVSNNTKLGHLYCRNNQIENLDVSNNTGLLTLWCGFNKLSTLDVSKNLALNNFVCCNNDLTALDVSNNIALEYINCGFTDIQKLDVSKHTALKTLWCDWTDLTALDVTNNTALVTLGCSGIAIETLDLSKNEALKQLYCYACDLKTLDLSRKVNLELLDCAGNELLALDFSNLSKLTRTDFGTQVRDLGVLSDESIWLNDLDTTVDVTKVTNVSGATYDSATGAFTDYVNGTPITYDYALTDANGTGYTMPVKLIFTVTASVEKPTVTPAAGTYTTNQNVVISCGTENATIYYTTDGSEPTTASKKYTETVPVTGAEGNSVSTTIKAIAVKDGMKNSEVATFTYVIEIPAAKYSITVNSGSASVSEAEAGTTVTITANAPATGMQFKEWSVVSGNITLASTENTETTFTMPEGAVEVTAVYEEIPDYTITDGANSIWTLGGTGGISVTGNGDYDKFTGVKVNGVLIAAENYDAKAGSTIVTLKADYLNTLAVATYDLELVWTDGGAATTFSVKEKVVNNNNTANNTTSNTTPDTNQEKKDEVPKTGEDQNVFFWMLLLVLSAAGAVVLAKKKDFLG